tara:strand:- start:2149 stop:2748 length:600 start_codon:yes stop_codon:yes gene_type:complete
VSNKKKKLTSNFIEQYHRSVSSADCIRLIQLFESNLELQTVGVSTVGFDPKIKDDKEISLTKELVDNNPDWNSAMMPILQALHSNVEKYVETYEGLNSIDQWMLEAPAINFQRFLPRQGYKKWHCENVNIKSSVRTLVWMLYLNTVNDKGGTEFYHQDFVCKAEIGKMVIWPPYWTHLHRSQVSPSEMKYILTGWMAYV